MTLDGTLYPMIVLEISLLVKMEESTADLTLITEK